MLNNALYNDIKRACLSSFGGVYLIHSPLGVGKTWTFNKCVTTLMDKKLITNYDQIHSFRDLSLVRKPNSNHPISTHIKQYYGNDRDCKFVLNIDEPGDDHDVRAIVEDVAHDSTFYKNFVCVITTSNPLLVNKLVALTNHEIIDQTVDSDKYSLTDDEIKKYVVNYAPNNKNLLRYALKVRTIGFISRFQDHTFVDSLDKYSKEDKKERDIFNKYYKPKSSEDKKN